MRALNVGIVGYGYATRTFHAPLVHTTPGLRLAVIATSDPKKVSADWPDVPTVASPEALFARPDLDLVVIATANDSHFPLARLALAAGKHVVVDKPFTLTAGEGRSLESLARVNDRVLSVFHNRRWDGDFLTLARLLGEGAVGRVVHFESHFDRFRPAVRDRWRERNGPGSGLWYDLAPHLLDQSLQLFGIPEAIFLDTALQRDAAQIDDYFHAILRYGPLRVVLHASALAAQPQPRFLVHGVLGSLVKHGIDPQEDALKAGRRPPIPAGGRKRARTNSGASAATNSAPESGEAWGVDPVPFQLTTCEDDVRTTREQASLPGDYPAYYAAVRDAIVEAAPNPVPARQAIAVMELLELGLESAALRREISIDTASFAADYSGERSDDDHAPASTTR